MAFLLDIKTIFYLLSPIIFLSILILIENLYSKKAKKTTEEYLTELALLKECSEHDIFFMAASDWNVSRTKIEEDFKEYLINNIIPYYVTDFVRKNKK